MFVLWMCQYTRSAQSLSVSVNGSLNKACQENRQDRQKMHKDDRRGGGGHRKSSQPPKLNPIWVDVSLDSTVIPSRGSMPLGCSNRMLNKYKLAM
jgi:hypothetical protein